MSSVRLRCGGTVDDLSELFDSTGENGWADYGKIGVSKTNNEGICPKYMSDLYTHIFKGKDVSALFSNGRGECHTF